MLLMELFLKKKQVLAVKMVHIRYVEGNCLVIREGELLSCKAIDQLHGRQLMKLGMLSQCFKKYKKR